MDLSEAKCALLLDAVWHMFRGMSLYIRYERTDFSVVVKSRGKPPNPMEVGSLSRWEIKRSGAVCGIFPDNGGGQQGGKRGTHPAIEKASSSRS